MSIAMSSFCKIGFRDSSMARTRTLTEMYQITSNNYLNQKCSLAFFSVTMYDIILISHSMLVITQLMLNIIQGQTIGFFR